MVTRGKQFYILRESLDEAAACASVLIRPNTTREEFLRWRGGPPVLSYPGDSVRADAGHQSEWGTVCGTVLRDDIGC